MPAHDLFTWLDALWNKQQLEGTFPVYVAHRFLASDRNLALFARALGRQVAEPALVFRTWQGLLPSGGGAPRLKYPAPKKPPQAEALVLRMMVVRCQGRAVVEELYGVAETMGLLAALYREYGVEPPDAPKDASPRNRKPKVTAAAPPGLLDLL